MTDVANETPTEANQKEEVQNQSKGDDNSDDELIRQLDKLLGDFEEFLDEQIATLKEQEKEGRNNEQLEDTKNLIRANILAYTVKYMTLVGFVKDAARVFNTIRQKLGSIYPKVVSFITQYGFGWNTQELTITGNLLPPNIGVEIKFTK